MENTENKLAEISQSITWDNWTVEEDLNKLWKVTEVLYCKLGWILGEAELDEEQKDTLETVRDLIESMGLDDYKNN